MLPQFLTSPDPGIYLTGSYLVLDFETTNLDKGDALNDSNNIVLSSYKVVRRKKGKVVSTLTKSLVGNEVNQQELTDYISSVDFIVAHNVKFELQWLHRCGLDLRSVLVYDTLLAEYVINGNRRRALDLSSCCKRRGLPSKESLVDKLIKAGVCPSTIPTRWLMEYCEQDVNITDALFRKQLAHIKSTHRPLLNVVYTRCLLAPVLADIEKNGMNLDAASVLKVHTETSRELAEVEEELQAICGDINLNSPVQLADFLYDELGFKQLTGYDGEPLTTPSGKRKTDIDTITALVATNERQSKFKELIKRQTKLNSALTKNLNFFLGVCNEHEGYFRGVFNQTNTSTHRLSSSGKKLALRMLGGKESGCQFQNFPRAFKNLFASRFRGGKIGEGDGAQLEFRIAGHLGRDSQVLYDIVHNVDIHQYTADRLTEAGEGTTRQEAKSSTFRPLYGGTKGTPAIEQYCQDFREKYKELSDTQYGWAREAAETKELKTEWGMIYYFPFAKVTKSGYIKDSTKIYNFPIQAFATAEIIPIALVYFWHRIKETEIIIVNTVHDSIICDLPPGTEEQFANTMCVAMIDDVDFYLKAVYDIELYTPLGCGIKVGDHWSKADKSLKTPIMRGIEKAGYEPINDKDEDEEFKAEAHRKMQ